jgi:hypothetical protein
MKIVNHLFYSGPVRWIILYIVLISVVSIIFASFRPPSATDNIEGSNDSSRVAISKTQKPLLATNKNGHGKPLPIKEKTETAEPAIDQIKEYSKKYNAAIFSSYSFPYSIDYQEKLKNTNVIFYVVIDDIFEENGRVYLKAAKSYLGLNIYLKLRCEKSMLNKLKESQFYTYIIARIAKVNSIYFNTKAVSSKNSDDNTDIDITLASNNKSLLITGRCLDIFENK